MTYGYTDYPLKRISTYDEYLAIKFKEKKWVLQIQFVLNVKSF
jgi:hypothetical protein